MAKSCPICEDERRPDIDKALKGPRTRQQISDEYGYKKHVTDNHAGHMGRNREVPDDGSSAVDPGALKAQLLDVITRAKKQKNITGEVNALKELYRILIDQVRLGQAASEQQAIHTQPAFQSFIAELLPALGGCKTCRPLLDACVARLATPGGTREGNGSAGGG